MVIGRKKGPYLQQNAEGRHGALVVIHGEHALHAQRCGRHAVKGLHEGALMRVLAAGPAVHGQAHRQLKHLCETRPNALQRAHLLIDCA